MQHLDACPVPRKLNEGGMRTVTTTATTPPPIQKLDNWGGDSLSK